MPIFHVAGMVPGSWRTAMNKKYIVRLEPQERTQLRELVSAGKGAARKLTHARILLLADVSAEGSG